MISLLDAPIAHYGRWRTLLLLFGLSLRLCCAPCPGFVQDFVYFRDWVRYMDVYGFAGIYRMDPVTEQVLNYPPFYLYALAAQEGLYRLLLPPVDPDGMWYRTLYKLPPILADLALAFVVMVIVRRRQGDRPALLAGAAVALNPAVWYTTAYWGQVDSVFTLLVLLALWMANQRRFEWAGACAALAVLAKVQSVVFIPLLALAALRRKDPLDLVRFAVVGFLVALLVLAPFIIAGTAGLVFQKAFVENLSFFPYLTFNAANLWGLHPAPETLDWQAPYWVFDSEMKAPADSLPARLLTYKNIGLALLLAVYLAAHVHFWRRPAPDDLVRAAAVIAGAFFLLPTEQHERYLFPCIVFLAVLMPRHRGLRWTFAALSVVYLLNLARVLPPETLFYPLSLLTLILGGLAAWFLLAAAGRSWDPETWIARRRPFAAAALVALLLPVALWLPRIRPDHTYRYLSDWGYVDYAQDWGPVVADANLAKGPIRLGPYRFRKGLGVHANSTIVYSVAPHSDAFESWMGLDAGVLEDPEAAAGASVAFSVEVDGQFPYRSPVVGSASPPIHVRVPVRGAKQLVLRVHDAGDGNRHDRACWGGARFVRDPGWQSAVEERVAEP